MTRAAFVVCHALLGLLFLVFAAGWLKEQPGGASRVIRSPLTWLWAALVLGFLIPGAYLEFPGDGWVHLHRINSLRTDQILRDNVWSHRFAYFWGWSFLSFVQPASKRLAMDVYSAFWQALLAFHFYRLARRLGFPPGFAFLQVLGAVALFGNSVFGFFRYYALASTPLAHIGYLAAAVMTLDLFERRGRALEAVPALLGCLLLMAANHVQALLLYGVFSLTLVGLRFTGFLRTFSFRRRAAVFAALLLLHGAALWVGAQLVQEPARYGLSPQLGNALWVSRLGCFRIWDPALSYSRTLAAHGTLALALALLFFRTHRTIAALTLAPVYFLVFPPYALAYANRGPLEASYRVLFLLPSSFMIVAVIHQLHLRWRRPAERRFLAVAAVLFIALARSAPPWFGKLRFQYHRPPPERSLEMLDAAAIWLGENRRFDSSCTITSDDVTEWEVAAWLGTRYNVEKVAGVRYFNAAYRPWEPQTAEDLARYNATQVREHFPKARGCGYLVTNRANLAQLPRPISWPGWLSGHWPAEAAHLAARVPGRLPEAAEGLLPLGWHRTFVPPFYWYYEPDLNANRP